ncbi:PaaI family thioesterase [Limibaculum sp. FT325]|uniref:PaaI family thioesterase n=1 Tax=Thermohalobaculum sediminis TaxID=2939436 RepID=UPI0020C127A2|nr:PaaI family thioesterase [Limibaculum sediminis]MCL5778041.1 PaaI family thioesterase [Limibaculum sediminis]
MSETRWQIRDADYARRVHASFARQHFMTLLGARLASVAPGDVVIELPVRADLEQQHGYVHAGACWSIADSAAGYASQTLMAAEDGVLTVELKINLLAPAAGDLVRAHGRVERAGRQLMVGRSDVYAIRDGVEKHVATALGTFMVMPGLRDQP